VTGSPCRGHLEPYVANWLLQPDRRDRIATTGASRTARHERRAINVRPAARFHGAGYTPFREIEQRV